MNNIYLARYSAAFTFTRSRFCLSVRCPSQPNNSRKKELERSRERTISDHVNLFYLLSPHSILRFLLFTSCPTLYLGTHGSKVGSDPWVGFLKLDPTYGSGSRILKSTDGYPKRWVLNSMSKREEK